jgi:CheY-like chemotaxis protein
MRMHTTRVLIVDDDAAAADLLARRLRRRSPFHLREETDITQAVETARRYRPDLILVDVDRPWKDDCDVERELKFDTVLRGVPMVRISALDSEEQRALCDGVSFLAKPIDEDQMIQVVIRSLMEDGQICAMG